MDKSVIDIPTFDGYSSVPVTEHKPLSAWIKKSYAFFECANLELPYPVISQKISFGFKALTCL